MRSGGSLMLLSQFVMLKATSSTSQPSTWEAETEETVLHGKCSPDSQGIYYCVRHTQGMAKEQEGWCHPHWPTRDVILLTLYNMLYWVIQGKSIFIYYALLRRLSEGLPTALEVFNGSFLFFTDTGASIYDNQGKSSGKIPPETWALSDSTSLTEEPCGAFQVASGHRCWIIQATSPKESRWKNWGTFFFFFFFLNRNFVLAV